MNDTASIVAALDASKATRVWFTTDFWSLSKPTRAKEAKLGYNVVDAIKQRSNQVKHVVYNSGAGADAAPTKMQEFWSKVDVERYMEKELGPLKITWSVLRPVAFLENLDDQKNGNPLKKGKIKMLTKPNIAVEYISCKDIGKGSAELLMHPELYAGQKIDAATCEHTGPELADILSEVSGTTCTYSMSVPRVILYLFVRQLYYLVTWIEQGGYDETDIDAFKKVVPDCQDAKAWFSAKGKWADGEKFVSKSIE
ncbi:unnamed protein product [Pseudo-nitzschia multistriata]|uniref:NmrA-like domain-containing protein n=1 Tax=Pseudo-nitzschia multistriata TaxID=183589 RepID=A0A448ZB85_9STRA|nr:unnamed protein product [Pseudo-nitzschia multistriata]